MLDTIDTTSEQYEHCEQCDAPVDHAQRYCVVCGTHRRHVHDPAARYLSTVARRSRSAGPRPASARRGTSPRLATALALAVIPIAVGLGVLVGRASTSGDAKLIAALKAQKPEVITTTVGGAAATAGPAAAARTASTVSALTSSFPLRSGYAVELQTLPLRTGESAVTKAQQADAAKGAPHPGLIMQRDYRVTPTPAAGDYVIYSGAYKTKAAAQRALATLRKKFAEAKVIEVQPVGASATPTTKVLAKTQYGSAHQVAGYQPSQGQVAAGGQVVQKIQQAAGKSYVDQQRGLPDAISVP